MKKLILIFITIIILGCENKNDKQNKYSIITTKYTQIHQIISKEVDDTFYVFIRLPKHYNENPNKRYPVLFLLDGDIAFNMATSVVRYLQFGKDIPDMIIVAPAYGTVLSDTETNYRERDYTFSPIERFKGSGGGEYYLNFLKKELIPFVDENFRTSDKKIINGYSLGGLFVINILLRNSDLFTDYIAGSPYLINDIDSLAKMAADSKIKGKKNLFISVGETEDKENYHKPITQIYNLLNENSSIKAKLEIFENGTHFTCPPEALAYGLKFIFKK